MNGKIAPFLRNLTGAAFMAAVLIVSASCAHTYARDIVVDGVHIAGFTGSAPAAPSRSADGRTPGGGSYWKDTGGRVVAIETASNKVFLFQYDQFGKVRQVSEPDGGMLVRKGDGRDWVRVAPDGQQSSFEGLVMIGNDYAVRYLAQDGSQSVYNSNGYVAKTRNVDGETRIDSLSDGRGRSCTFDYDASGQPAVVRLFDGEVLSAKPDGSWTRTAAGATTEERVPYLVARDPDDGTVYIKTDSEIVAYSTSGVERQKLPAGAPGDGRP